MAKEAEQIGDTKKDETEPSINDQQVPQTEILSSKPEGQSAQTSIVSTENTIGTKQPKKRRKKNKKRNVPPSEQGWAPVEQDYNNSTLLTQSTESDMSLDRSLYTEIAPESNTSTDVQYVQWFNTAVMEELPYHNENAEDYYSFYGEDYLYDEHNTTISSIESEVPYGEENTKYYAQRYRLFSKFDEGVQMDKRT
jgi:hypothetical protein